MGPHCGECGLKVRAGSLLSCSSCKLDFHPECVNVTDEEFELFVNAKWNCPSCVGKEYNQELIETHKQDVIIHTPDLKLVDILRGINSIKIDQKRIIKSIDCYREEVVNTRRHSFDMRQAPDISSRIGVLESENTFLKTKVLSLEQEVKFCKEELLRNIVEIYGVPVKADENLRCIVEDIGKAFDIPLENEIDSCFRKLNGKTKPPIVVRFLREFTKVQLITKSKTELMLTTNQIGWTDASPSKIYITEPTLATRI